MKCDGGGVFVYRSKGMQSVSQTSGSLASYLSTGTGVIFGLSLSLQKDIEMDS
jgi:hypothetical protein